MEKTEFPLLSPVNGVESCAFILFDFAHLKVNAVKRLLTTDDKHGLTLPAKLDFLFILKKLK